MSTAVPVDSPISTLEAALPIEYEPDTLFEVVDGQIVEKPPMGVYEISLSKLLYDLIAPYCASKPVGEVYHEMIFDLRPAVNRERRPDVSFVSYERWPKGKRIPRRRSWPVVPDLAVEIISKNNPAEEVVAKVNEYFKCGVRVVWVIYPTEEQVYSYTSPTELRIFTRAQSLDGGDVLPGFSCALSELFGEPGDEAPDGPQSAATG